jgi:hypothetical protein
MVAERRRGDAADVPDQPPRRRISVRAPVPVAPGSSVVTKSGIP